MIILIDYNKNENENKILSITSALGNYLNIIIILGKDNTRVVTSLRLKLDKVLD